MKTKTLHILLSVILTTALTSQLAYSKGKRIYHSHHSSYNHSSSSSHSSSSYSCGSKKYCSQMASCEEAKFYLKTCGLKRLDKDGDGIPCEKLCR